MYGPVNSERRPTAWAKSNSLPAPWEHKKVSSLNRKKKELLSPLKFFDPYLVRKLSLLNYA